jgi:hypothetical protein
MQTKLSKAAVLDLAKSTVQDRGDNYGTVETNFGRIARRWSLHFYNRYGITLDLDVKDVAMMMADLKLARLEHTPTHEDSWVDLAGYAACGGARE